MHDDKELVLPSRVSQVCDALHLTKIAELKGSNTAYLLQHPRRQVQACVLSHVVSIVQRQVKARANCNF